jgi:LPXTG-site transpeptidase (sortase) family protein
MEGTLYDRRMIRRPTPRPVLGRPTDEASHGHTVHAEAAKTVEVKDETQSHTATSQFSKLTPIYATSMNHTHADKVRAIKLSMDLKQSHPSKKVQNVAVDVAEAVAYQLNLVSLVDLESAEVKMPEYFASHQKPKHHHVPVRKHHVAIQATSDADTLLLPGHNLSGLQRQFAQEQFKHHLKSKTLHRKIAQKVKVNTQKMRQPRTWIVVFLFGVVLTGVYATFDSFSINQQAREALAKEASASNAIVQAPIQSTTMPVVTPAATTQVPNNASTVATSKTAANYAVAPDLPRFIKIPKLGINAPIVSVGLDRDGSVGTPSNIYEAAWYNGSAKPGTNGASFIDAHSSASGGALFGHLDRLTNGDKIQVQNGDGSTITYQVMSVQIVPKDSVDMASMLRPFGSTSKGLNLITCQGNWIDSEKTLTHRVLVYTQQVS